MPASQVIVPFLPTCTHGTLSLRDFVPSYAHQYQPLSGTYYEKIIPTTVPGIVVGGLAVLAALLMTIWLFVHTCCKCFRRRSREDKRPQFILGSPGSGASRITRPPEYEEGEVGSDHGQLGRGEPLEQGSRRACNASITLQILIGLFMLATVGTSGWALAISLKDTSYQIPDFWSAVSTVQIDARNANTGLTSLYTDLATLDQNAQIVLQDSTNLIRAASTISAQFGGSTQQVVNELMHLEGSTIQGRTELGVALQSVLDAQRFVGNQLTTSIAQFSNSYKSLTLNGFQNIGRVVIAAVLFGLTIAFSLLVGALCIKLWSPLLTIFVIILYWILVAALLLIGVGFFLGVERVGNETCLYSETFVMSQARTRITDAVTQSIAVNALKYYFNHTLPIDDTAASTIESILKNTLGLTLSKVINFLQDPQLQYFVNLINDGTVLGSLSAMLSASTTNAIQALAQLVPSINNADHRTIHAVSALVILASRSTVYPLYEQVKHLICCDGAPAAHDLFVAWVVVGSLAFVLALLCSTRIIMQSVSRSGT